MTWLLKTRFLEKLAEGSGEECDGLCVIHSEILGILRNFKETPPSTLEWPHGLRIKSKSIHHRCSACSGRNWEANPCDRSRPLEKQGVFSSAMQAWFVGLILVLRCEKSFFIINVAGRTCSRQWTPSWQTPLPAKEQTACFYSCFTLRLVAGFWAKRQRKVLSKTFFMFNKFKYSRKQLGACFVAGVQLLHENYEHLLS